MALQKRYQGRHEIAGTHIYARAYQDPDQTTCICVIEEGPKSPVPLEHNRTAVTKQLAKSMGRQPDQVQWLEQSRDGQLREYRCHPVSRRYSRPTQYRVTEPKQVSDARVRSVEFSIGEKLETHAQQLAREFREHRLAPTASDRPVLK
jgi:hypothetical protein